MFRSWPVLRSADVRRDDLLDHQQFAVRAERTMAELQETSSSLIVQDVQDLLEQVQIGALWQPLEEVAAQ